MVEQLGWRIRCARLDPARPVWHCLPVAGMAYLVVQRNFDIISSPLNQFQYSPYVNNILYSYTIDETCSPAYPLAVTVPFSVDPLADIYSPVASLGAIFWGDYYTGLTRDDVAGLRYLFTTNNINWETPAPGALLLTTNFGGYTVLTTSNLNTLLLASQTNAPGLIPGLFPGVVNGDEFHDEFWRPLHTDHRHHGHDPLWHPVSRCAGHQHRDERLRIHPDAPVFGHLWRHHHQCQSHQHAQFPAERRQRGVELFHQHVRQPRDGFAGDAI